MKSIRLSLAFFGMLLWTTTFFSCSTSPAKEVASEKNKVKEDDNAETAGLLKKSELILMPIINQNKQSRRTINGRVIPLNTTQIFSEVQGKVKSGPIIFKSGTQFRKGQLLIDIDKKEFELGLESQRSAFLNALTGIMPDMKSDYPNSYEQWLNYVQQYNFGEPLNELPIPQSNEEKYFLTSNQIYSLFFQIKAQEERLTKYQIYAPYNGSILQASIDIGSLVSPGQSLGTIINSNNFELEAGIPVDLANKLKINSKITFTSKQSEGTWEGRVVRKSNIIDPQTQNIPVYFSLSGRGLNSGMYLEGKIEANTYQDVAVIPSQALGRDESVLVLDEDVISRRPVKPLEFLSDSIIVTGLNEKDLVILNQFDTPVEGLKINR